jgi:aspartyl-tRNA(Asn)/glutamyl-tRNA(Gln) amidotransferase subunit A
MIDAVDRKQVNSSVYLPLLEGTCAMTFPPDAQTMAAAHRRGEQPVTQTVRHALHAARAAQASLNAFAEIADDAALRDAAAIEAALARGEDPGLLAGVPISVKDILDVAGLPTRWGSPLMAQAKPAAADIAAVARLRAAGAIIIGKTTTTEFAHAPLGGSPLNGITRNPWAYDLACGGSSSGAGSSVAAGITRLALTTDAGCSTRLPASCTGVFGLKPSLGCIPHDRVPDAFANFIHLGLIGASVADIALGLDVVAGPDRRDPHSLFRPAPQAMAHLLHKVLDGARIGLWLQVGNQMVAEEIVAVTRQAAASLRALGAQVTELPYKLFNPDPVWRTLQQTNWAARFAAAPAADRAQLSASFLEGIAAGAAYSGLDLNRALVRRTELFRGVQTMFAEEVDFILTPCISAPPVAADFDLSQPLMIDGVAAGDIRSEWTPYLSLFDLTGHPAIAVPAGLGVAGAPLGVQLVAPWGQDGRLLAAAAQFAAACPPPRLPGTENA